MSDKPALPAPKQPLGRRLALTPSTIGLLGAIGFVVLAIAIILVWQSIPGPPPPAADPAQVAALGQQVQALEQRLARVEAKAPPDLSPLEARIAALEQKRGPDLAPLDHRIAALEQKIQAMPEPVTRADIQNFASKDDIANFASKADLANFATKADLASFSSRLDAIASRQDQLASRAQGLETTFTSRLDADEAKLTAAATSLAGLPVRVDALDKRLSGVEQQAGKVNALADKAGRIGRIQAAQAALDAGQPLGDLPGAPPALARFAQNRPPTEASLRLSFPAAADAALAASRPRSEGQPFLGRVWNQAQDMVTLRQGDKVILGDPAAGVIARAKQALAAGDLAGSVAALDALSGPPAQAMAEWKAEAQQLLDARAALTTMAARA